MREFWLKLKFNGVIWTARWLLDRIGCLFGRHQPVFYYHHSGSGLMCFRCGKIVKSAEEMAKERGAKKGPE